MNDFLSKVKWLHVELSSRCNAWCPSCARNKDGYGLVDGLVEQDLSLERLKQIVESLPNLTTVQLCGNLGDPIAAKNIFEHLDYLISKKIEIRIHTNGSLKTPEWWTTVGYKIKDTKHLVFFGLDGLDDTHEIYRQGTNYHKIIDNATAFINSGGIAIWQFIPFAHNEHQLKKAIALSKKLKFHKFFIQRKPHVNHNAKHFKTGKLLDIKEWSLSKKFEKYTKHYDGGKSCMHLEYPSLYVNANGSISPCCFLPKINYNDGPDISKELNTVPRYECKINCNF